MDYTTLGRGVDAINGASFAAMQWRLIEHTAQIRKAGERHHDCCRSLAEVAEHEHGEALVGQPVGDGSVWCTTTEERLMPVDGWCPCGAGDHQPYVWEFADLEALSTIEAMKG